MDPLLEFSVMLDDQMVKTRLRDLAHLILGSREERLSRMRDVLSELPPAWYLIGVGPNFSDIIRVGKSEIVIGRSASVLEQPADAVIDYAINDAMLTGPREVSRVHLTVRVASTGNAIEVRDESSSTGTWLLDPGTRLKTSHWHRLEQETAISLGPGAVNVLMPLWMR